VEKVKEGVDVRLIYDDLGCAFTLPADYPSKLEKMGIKTGPVPSHEAGPVHQAQQPGPPGS